ncbi:MAG: hypothetical protein NUW06_08335 [Candidatus Acetothermia bacterium]|nr:hypothetical protein [Candidatus Acetothermia bacterium]
MLKVTRFRLLMLTMVLGIAVASVAGITFSSSSAEKGVVTAIRYSDVIRFAVQDEQAAVMRAEVFNLTGKRLYDSGPVMGRALDWAMTTEAGERVANGVYLYVITAWDSQGELAKSQAGKLALVPGSAGLGQAPSLAPGAEGASPEAKEEQVRALAYSHKGDWTVSGKLGVGTDNPDPSSRIHLFTPSGNLRAFFQSPGGTHSEFDFFDSSALAGRLVFAGGNAAGNRYFGFLAYRDKDGNSLPIRFFTLKTGGSGTGDLREVLYLGTGDNPTSYFPRGRVGIGTVSPAATLEVKGSTANLLVLKDPADNTVFRVEKDGDVYADRAYHCGLASGCFQAGSGADVAERIDASEAVEPGDVVEIDPLNPGLYRKAREPRSTRVAGVISTAPAITLGNNFDARAEIWEDSRPLLALAGRVPVKATTENGPIRVADFLTTSSTPGYAMRCAVLSHCTGAILGKALEPLEERTGVIMVQVTLR